METLKSLSVQIDSQVHVIVDGPITIIRQTIFLT